MLEHPFLPPLYATLDSPRWSCLLTEFCPGGDLHVLRQRQPDRRFDEAAVRYVWPMHACIHPLNIIPCSCSAGKGNNLSGCIWRKRYKIRAWWEMMDNHSGVKFTNCINRWLPVGSVGKSMCIRVQPLMLCGPWNFWCVSRALDHN